MIQKLGLVFLTLFLMSCSSVLYFPEKQQFFDPKKFKLSYEDVYFPNRENEKIHGWWFDSKTKPAKGTVVYFHGNGQNLSAHFLSMAWLPDAGYNLFIFDYPGYGQSEGEPSPAGNVDTGREALHWVHENKDKSPLIVYGQSMGGIVALRTVQEVKDKTPIRAVIADGTFSSFQRIGRKKLAQHWLTWLLQPLAYVVLWDTWAADVEKISPIPLIVIHGEKDQIVEFEHGVRIAEDAKDPKTFIPVPNGQHGDLFWVDKGKYRKIVFDQIESLK